MKAINECGRLEEYRGELSGGGTSLQGYVEVSFKDLKRMFGEPTDGDGYKVDAQWLVMTPSGVGTVYNYKDGKNYCGRDGTPKTKITEWHIGGTNSNTYAWVALAILIN